MWPEKWNKIVKKNSLAIKIKLMQDIVININKSCFHGKIDSGNSMKNDRRHAWRLINLLTNKQRVEFRSILEIRECNRIQTTNGYIWIWMFTLYYTLLISCRIYRRPLRPTPTPAPSAVWSQSLVKFSFDC